MKGFKPFGKNTRAGFHFPVSAGFTNSSGKMQTVKSYTRKVAHLKRSNGGLPDGMPVAPTKKMGAGGKFAKGGVVQSERLSDKRSLASSNARVPQGNGRSFNRTPLVGDCED